MIQNFWRIVASISWGPACNKSTWYDFANRMESGCFANSTIGCFTSSGTAALLSLPPTRMSPSPCRIGLSHFSGDDGDTRSLETRSAASSANMSRWATRHRAISASRSSAAVRISGRSGFSFLDTAFRIRKYLLQ
uniref:(northern house mosquito) hypothetical protein n=1 Tax=Culex pipiens TaxID=7175 RepID=A0A8D8BG07_CULPI